MTVHMTQEHVVDTSPVTFITQDADLEEAVLRLAAAADVGIAVYRSVSQAGPSYSQAAVVILDSDALVEALDADPVRRPHVLILARHDDASVWRQAVELGAERVLLWPDDERTVYELLVDSLHSRAQDSPLVCVVPGCGGAGASSLAVALAEAAGARLSDGVLLIDGDPVGGGLDVSLGAESIPGLRWPDLARTSGRVAPDSLRRALPVSDHVHLLSHARRPVEVEATAWESMVSAGARGFPLTIIDGEIPPGASRYAHVIVVVPAELRAVAAAAARLPQLLESTGNIRVVVRQRRDSDLDVDDVAAVLPVPVVGAYADSRPVTRERIVELLLVGLDLFPHERRLRRRAA